MTQTQPFVSAMIVNYRSHMHTLLCIKSLQLQQGVRLEIIVVDNCSGDESVIEIRRAYPEIKLIENANNDGFAKANNIAAAHAKGDYLLVVNPDIQLFQNDAIKNMVDYLLSHPAVGVLSPDVIEPRKNRHVLPKRKYPLQDVLKATIGLNDLPGNYAWVLGACMLFPAAVYRKIHGFSEAYFLYGEDTDICLRLRKAGYVVDWISSVKAEHWSGASEQGSPIYQTRLRKKRGYYQFIKTHYAVADVTRILNRQLIAGKLKVNFLKLIARLTWGKVLQKLNYSITRNQAEVDAIVEHRRIKN